MVTTSQLVAALKSAGCVPESDLQGKRLQISSHVIRCDDFQGAPTVFVGCGDDDLIRNAVVDGVHWVGHKHPKAVVLQVAVPSALGVPVKQALWTLAAACSAPRVNLLSYEVLGSRLKTAPLVVVPPAFASSSRVIDWKRQLASRPSKVPELGRVLEALLKTRVPAFRWYRNLTSTFWSGRVGGWQVCTMEDGGSEIRFGRTDKERSDNPSARSGKLQVLVSWVEGFAKKRSDPESADGGRKREHLLESAIWRGPEVIPVKLPGRSTSLIPMVDIHEPPLQVPALYSDAPEASARFVDAVMKDGTTPWVLELKVDSAGQGKYYRHAVSQAVLYRDFLRAATPLHGWFRQLGVRPEDFQGAVVFPQLKGTEEHRNQLLKPLRETADRFGIAVVELPWDWGRLHGMCMG